MTRIEHPVDIHRKVCTADPRPRVSAILAATEAGLYERAEPVRLAFLAAISGESIFFLGPPGVAKSMIARRIKFAFEDAESFEYLMGRFSTPEEIFGPISLKKLKESDSYERLTRHYLPEADVVFLDEIWKASPPIQNALLTALNERVYRNGEREMRLPLKLVIAASNEVPEAHAEQSAFWDRFLIRILLRPISEESAFQSLIRDTGDPYADPVPETVKISTAEYERWRTGAASVEMPRNVMALLWSVSAHLRSAQSPEIPDVTDRRWKKIAGLLRTSAFLHGRSTVSVLDCGVLEHTIWNAPDDIGAARLLVSDALRSFDHGWKARMDGLAHRLADAKAELTCGTREEKTVEVEAPVAYREEYYRLSDYPFDGVVLAWRGDYERLRSDQMVRCDLFFYTSDDQYSHSESVPLRRPENAHVVETDSGAYAIETEKRLEHIAEAREPSAAERTRLRDRSAALQYEAEALLREIVEYRDKLMSEADAHHFLSESARAAIAEGIDLQADAVGELDLEIRRHYDAVAVEA